MFISENLYLSDMQEFPDSTLNLQPKINGAIKWKIVASISF